MGRGRWSSSPSTGPSVPSPAGKFPLSTHHSFTGQRQDTQHGLILFPARAYDPELGRFLQPDPFVQDPSDPQTLNRYSYVRNNPVNFVDPSGYFFGLDDLLFAVILISIGVSIASSIGSVIAAETGHPRAAQRFAKVARVSAQVAGYATIALGIVRGLQGGPSGGVPLQAFAASEEGGGGGEGGGGPPGWLLRAVHFLADAATQHANRAADRERARAQALAQETGVSEHAAQFIQQFGGVNELSFIKGAVDVYGKGISYAKAGARATFIQFRTQTPFSRGTIDELTTAASFQGGAGLDGLGIAFKLSAHLMNLSSEYRFLTYGYTA